MVTAPELYALQETDQALDKAQARLAEIESELVESEEMILAREEVDRQSAAVAELRSRLTDAEWSVDEVRDKASEVEGKLYGGTITNPKELADLNADLSSLKGQVGKREDVLLGLLMDMDEAESQLAAKRDAYSRIEADWNVNQHSLLSEKAQLEPLIAELQARRDSQAPSFDRSTLRLYDLLRERHGGYAVARVERGMCQGCRITLPVSILQKVRSGMALVQCVSCERILFAS
jgi:hypothetical protein